MRVLQFRPPLGPLAALALFAAAAVTGCSSGPPGTTAAATADPVLDKLAQVRARGTLVLPVDVLYPPASFGVEGATRDAATRCSPDQLTGPEVDGYDVATGKLIADAIAVEPCFVEPTWNEVVAGGWGDRWDLSFSSIGILRSRMDGLVFTRPYYGTPERFFVATGSTFGKPEDLSARKIGVCVGCFADLYLQGALDAPGEPVEYRVANAEIVGYASEPSGLKDVADGKIDAFLCQETAGQQGIEEGLALRAIEPEAYVAYPGGALDRSSGKRLGPFLEKIDRVLGAALDDGTLARLSETYFGYDYADYAAAFDPASIEQTVP